MTASSLAVLDGDRFRILHRFPTRFALHGGPKFTADGRFVYASRDGWIACYDLQTLEQTAEIRRPDLTCRDARTERCGLARGGSSRPAGRQPGA